MKNYKIFTVFCVMTVSLILIFASCAMPGSGSRDQTQNGAEDPSGVSDSAEEDSGNTVRLTFPEGFTVSQIADRLEENGVCSAEDFRSEADKTEYLGEFGIEISNPGDRAFLLEGYLFPDTYDFYKNENVSSVIKKFLRNTMSRFNDDFKARARELGYSLDEIITLASVVQKESGGGGEAARVSSVIHNRLDSPDFKRLQCDATISYLKGSVKPYFDEDTYYKYCENYNTYMCDGLPAGAINNPGLTSIKAALYPESTPYYFFVTDSDGVYHYSETWQEHQSNVARAGL